ncbi:MAG TPA: hypothetical protein VGI39_24550 [Polyangiaceae bacterium]|jgi:Flp pilus assembly pilin Flp
MTQQLEQNTAGCRTGSLEDEAAAMRLARITRFVRDTRGAVMVEYSALLGFVGIVTLPALILCGIALTSGFQAVRNFLLYPFP